MSYKTIAFHIDAGKRCSLRVDVAIRCAVGTMPIWSGCMPCPFEPPGYVMAEMGPAIMEAQRLVAATEIARTEGEFAKQTSAAGLRNVEWRTSRR